MASGLATTDKRARARAFRTTTRLEQNRNVTKRSVPRQRYKPSKARPTSTESPT